MFCVKKGCKIINITSKKQDEKFEEEKILKQIDEEKRNNVAKQIERAIEKNNVTFEDVLKEFNKNIEMIEQYEKEIRESDVIKGEIAIDLLTFYTKTKEKIIKTRKDEEKYEYLFSQKKQDSPNPRMNKMVGLLKILYLATFSKNISPFLDINIIHTIIKNRDKKVIFICAGAEHILNIEKFLADHYKFIELGFKLQVQQ